MDKQSLVEQMRAQLRDKASIAHKAQQEAAEEARHGATPGEKRNDARIALEYSQMARAQSKRFMAVRSELETLDGFRPKQVPRVVELGAVVEVEDEECGEGRTFFLAPVGAGMTLHGPGGDGHLSVVTPKSPIGGAVLGRRVGDVVDVTVKGIPREWTILYVE